jgi:hypothetical protein
MLAPAYLLEARPLRPVDIVRNQQRFPPASSDERQAARIVHPETGDERAGATVRSRSGAGSWKKRGLVSRVGLIGFCSLAVAAVAGFWRHAWVMAAESLRPACAGLLDEAQTVSHLRR